MNLAFLSGSSVSWKIQIQSNTPGYAHAVMLTSSVTNHKRTHGETGEEDGVREEDVEPGRVDP